MMDRFEIDGGVPLHGTVACAGSKNATLPLMAASLLAEGTTVLQGVPDLQDIRTMAMVMRVTGAEVRLEDRQLTLDCSRCNFWEAPYELVRKMRASFYVLGPLVARFGKARVSLPGGCALGPRPVDLHLKALKQLGCAIEVEGGYVTAAAKKLKGCRIDLNISSVGATGNILMAATAAEGVTEIYNAACEPEIVELTDFLKALGAVIEGRGTSHLTIGGGTPLKSVVWKVIPDRIETATLLLAAAATRGAITVSGCRPDHLALFLTKLAETGVQVSWTDDALSINAEGIRLRGGDVTTAIYPGFATDLQAPWTALMCRAEGSSIITDTIYPDRFNHVPELSRLGADVQVKLNSAYVRGVERLTAASVMCSDIRAAAALVIAALSAEGRSSVLRVYHLDRGHERLEERLNQLGARIQRIRE